MQSSFSKVTLEDQNLADVKIMDFLVTEVP